MRSLSFPLRATSRPSSTNRFLTRSIFLILILRTREISSLVEQLIFHSLLSQLSKIRALRICWELCFPFELSSWRDLRSSSVSVTVYPVSYTHLRAHETDSYLVCRLLLEKKKNILTTSETT